VQTQDTRSEKKGESEPGFEGSDLHLRPFSMQKGIILSSSFKMLSILSM
jgi:hypothetical protein